MKKIKQLLIGVLVAAIVAGSLYGSLIYLKKNSEKKVLVTSVSGLASDSYYMANTNLEGYITTSVSQNVTMDSDMIVEEVNVQKGSEVKKGDVLVSFDMTLVEMELNIEKLKRVKLDQDIKKAEQRLVSLQNGGPIEEESQNPDDDISGTGNSGLLNDTGEPDDEASAVSSVNGTYLAAVVPRVFLTSFSDDSAENMSGETANNDFSVDGEIADDSFSGNDNSSDADTDFGDGGMVPGTVISEEVLPTVIPEPEDTSPTATPVPTEIPVPAEPPSVSQFDDGMDEITDGEPDFYQVLTYDTEPYEGTGTEEDPYVFLCSSAKGKVTLKGEFLNRMAGFNADGTERVELGGSWFLLEFHHNDTIEDFTNRKASCTGYFLIDGSLLEEAVNRFAEMELLLDDASHYEEGWDEEMEDILPEDDGWVEDDNGGSSSTMTRADAIRLQKTRIASLNLDAQESDINIASLEKKLKRKVVYSKLDGVVSYVGDSSTASSSQETFIRVKSKEGFYLTGTVGELMLDQVEEGTVLNCNSYEVGSFTATVTDVSDYPVSSDSMGFSEGNPNVSYYSFTASIEDQSLPFQDQDYISVTLNNNVNSGDNIVIYKAFVRTEDGVSYVYKDDNGVLKKQIVTVGPTVDSGYNILIRSGITRDDMIAFPYGDDVKEGAKTREGTLEEMYD